MDDTKLDTLQILLIIIVPSLITGIPAIISAIGAWQDKRKRLSESLSNEGTAAEKVSNAWEKLVEDLQKRINNLDARQIKFDEKEKELENRLDRQGKRISHLTYGVQILIGQITALGATPEFILDNNEE